jgi:ATP-dependent Clp protease ATP-binding subunit ClpB
VLDDGRLTDGQGRTVDFRNVLIIMTSNLGAEYLAAQPDGEDVNAVRDQVMEVVKGAFRPEFLNRIDETLLFRRLGRENMRYIVDIQLSNLRKMLADREIVLEVNEDALDWLGEAGYDPAHGARPLKRVIQRVLQNPLANLILAGDVVDGQTLNVTVEGPTLAINGKRIDGEDPAIAPAAE